MLRNTHPLPDVSVQNAAAKSTADEWWQDQTTPIVLDRGRIGLTIRMWRYYRTQWERLYNDNPEQFEQMHLPRLIFAWALCKVIAESEHAELYNELKQKFDPDSKEQ